MSKGMVPIRKGRFSEIKSWQEQYKKKICKPEEPASLVKDGDVFATQGANTFPRSFANALTNIVLEKDYHVTGVLMFILGQFPMFEEKASKNFQFYDGFLGAERACLKYGNMNFVPFHLGDVGMHVHHRKPRIVAIAVSPPNADGWMSRSYFAHHIDKIAWNDPACEMLVVEINENLPYINTEGEYHSAIHVSDVDYIIENTFEPIPVSTIASTAEEEAIGKFISEMIDDGDCIQVGIGGLPNVITSNMKSSGIKNLGLHSEIITNGVAELIQAGIVNNSRKNIDCGKSVFAAGLGDQVLWNYINTNPKDVLLLEGAYTNNVGIIAQIDNMVTINNCLEVDLTGQVNSESQGTTQYSASGGQFQFVYGSRMSKGGKCFLALNSTFKDKSGNLRSKIVPTLTPGGVVTTLRTSAQYIVTEYGVADVSYRSLKERAVALIKIAHPQFQDELTAQAKKIGWL
jgi:acyl-CoA hydrolase